MIISKNVFPRLKDSVFLSQHPRGGAGFSILRIAREVWPALGGLNDRAQAALTNAMLDWIEDDSRTAGTDLKLGLHRWKAVLALYASALSREPLELGGFDPPEDLFEKLGEAPRA